jgi:hypothetical protein
MSKPIPVLLRPRALARDGLSWPVVRLHGPNVGRPFVDAITPRMKRRKAAIGYLTVAVLTMIKNRAAIVAKTPA